MRLAKRTASPVPLYFKVMMRLRDDILSGTWSYGHRLPGEIELARQLGVSVITVRQALAQLCQEKLLTPRVAQRNLRQLEGAAQKIGSTGG